MNKILILFLTSLFFSNAFGISLSKTILSKAIYDVDDRELVTPSSSVEIQKLSQSIAMIISEDDLISKDLTNSTSIIFSNLLSDKPPVGSNYCPSEKFATNHNYRPACTGFLIAKDILLTAGHCFLSKNDCYRKKIIFDVTSETEVQNGFKVPNENIYSCKKIISQKYSQGESLLDYAIIQLDRKTYREPLRYRQAKKIPDTAKLFMIGHPLGLPLIYSSNAHVLENTEDHYFKATLDSFHGNSGSPVFNSETNMVEGILVRGEADEFMDQKLNCNKYATYSGSDDSKGEGVTRMTSIIPYLSNKNPFKINIIPEEDTEGTDLFDLGPFSSGFTNGTGP